MRLIFIILANLLTVYMIIMFIRAIISWFRVDPYNPIIQMMDQIIEPVVGPVRRMLPPVGGLDLSFLVIFLILGVLRRTLLQIAVTF